MRGPEGTSAQVVWLEPDFGPPLVHDAVDFLSNLIAAATVADHVRRNLGSDSANGG